MLPHLTLAPRSLATRTLCILLPSLLACGGSSSHAAAATTDAGDKDAGGTAAADGSATDSGSDATAPATPPSLVTEPGDGMTPIYNLITSAKTSLDMTMYELTDTTATGLLTAAAKNGVMVRVILDQNLEMRSNTTAYDALSAGGVAVHWANPSYAATHQKTITIDGTTSAVMTLNFTPEYYTTTRDFAVITHDAADIKAIESTFGDDFANTAVTPPLGTDLVWSPTNSESSMVALINDAKTTLLVENEEMSDDDIVEALEGAAVRGVAVEIVMTASKSWDTNFTGLTTAGAKVVTYARDASLYIHAKVILADYGTSTAKVFIGSENFSNASLTENRELGVILSDSGILDSIDTTLTSDFKGGTAY